MLSDLEKNDILPFKKRLPQVSLFFLETIGG